MSKTVGGALLAHLQGEELTVSFLWKITRVDTTVFGFTNNSRDIVYLGTTYQADSGHTPSNIKTSIGLAVDNLEVQSIFDSQNITESDVQAGLWDFAKVEIFVVNYEDLTMGHMQLRTGWLGEVNAGKSAFVAELRGIMQALQQTIGRVYSPSCDANFGDARCGLNLATYTATSSVTSSTSRRIFTDTARAEANGYFNGGLVTWTSGDNAGLAMEVKTYADDVITLQQPMPEDITAGDGYTISKGCAKDRAACKTVSNIINFRGFPDVPVSTQT